MMAPFELQSNSHPTVAACNLIGIVIVTFITWTLNQKGTTSEVGTAAVLRDYGRGKLQIAQGSNKVKGQSYGFRHDINSISEPF